MTIEILAIRCPACVNGKVSKLGPDGQWHPDRPCSTCQGTGQLPPANHAINEALARVLQEALPHCPGGLQRRARGILEDAGHDAELRAVAAAAPAMPTSLGPMRKAMQLVQQMGYVYDGHAWVTRDRPVEQS